MRALSAGRQINGSLLKIIFIFSKKNMKKENTNVPFIFFIITNLVKLN